MAETRKIKQVWRSRPTIEGAGVHLHRAFGQAEVPRFDPFLLLDDFSGDDPAKYSPGFPWHPHRGIETITYVQGGTVEHGDSLGNAGVIGPGDVQWMTAGSGIIHQEMPHGDDRGVLTGFQLWANLPAQDKMMAPRYRDVTRAKIPEVEPGNGASVRVICGEINGVRGPVRDIVIDPEYLDVSLPAGSRWRHPVKAGHTVFAYVTAGRAFFCEERRPFDYAMVGAGWSDLDREPGLSARTLVLFDDGSEVTVSTEGEPVRFLLVAGRPLGEPVAWWGPIVMNTQAELERAFAEYRNGTFIKQTP